jgi:hypothetical protein
MVMSRVHVFPLHQIKLHDTERGADCVCEPRVIFHGKDELGEDAIIFVHELISKERAKEIIKERAANGI